MDQGNSPGWIATIGSLVTTIGVAGLAVWKAYTTIFGEKKHHHGDSDEHQAEGARANLDDVQKEWFDGMRQDLRDVRTENASLRKDRDRGWDLAREWREIAKDERHMVNNLRTMLGQGNTAAPPLPGLEDVEGRKPSA